MKYSKEKYLETCNTKFGDDKFKYDLDNYENLDSIIRVECLRHGWFEIIASAHMRSKFGCTNCANCLKNKHRIFTREKVIDFNKVHNFRYDYTDMVYINNNTNIYIRCKSHGIFTQLPKNHKSLKQGCPDCNSGVSKNTEYYLKLYKEKYKDEYDYYLVDKDFYKNEKTVIEILCNYCNRKFHKSYEKHLSQGCPRCNNNFRYDTETFIEEAKLLKPESNFDYSNVQYINNHTPISIICLNHGNTFDVKPKAHLYSLSGGCEFCNFKSKGEENITKYLKDNNINFIRNYVFKGEIRCQYKRDLIFDFFIPDKNIFIEFDGKQHLVDEPFFNDPYLKLKDHIKNKFSIEHNISLYRIYYTDVNNVSTILNKIFNI